MSNRNLSGPPAAGGGRNGRVLICLKVFRAQMTDNDPMYFTDTVTVTPAVPRPAGAARPAAAPVFLPREHGSWFLVLEPLALGLLIAPSWAGGALAVTALAAFFIRRPLKPALSAVHSRRRREAREVVVLWSALVVAGLFELLVLGEVRALWPLGPAVLLGGCFLAFDLEGEGRAEAAEIAGSAAFAFLPAACATLAGEPAVTGLVLAGLALARSLPAVMVVRAGLRQAKGETPAPGLPRVVSLLAFALLVSFVLLRLAPVAVLIPGALLLARAGWLLARSRPAWPARRIGQLEAAWGVLYLLVLVANWPSPA